MIKSIDFLLVTVATLLLFYFHNNLILIALLLLICFRLKISIKKRERFITKSIIILNIIFLCYLLVQNNHLIFLRIICFCIISLIILLVYDFKIYSVRSESFFKKTLATIVKSLLSIFLSLAIALVFFTLFPRSLVNILPPLLGGNVEGIKESYISKSNHLIHKNINYPSSYENSRLDIYQNNNPKGTLFFVHGGGYMVYDKAHRIDYLIRFVNAGYNVVNINYSLFPNNTYPDTTKQILDAYIFIINNAETFNIDTNKIFLSGDSAGGQLAGQLALLLTNTEYRKNLNIHIDNNTLQAKPLAFTGIATMFDPSTANATNFPPANWLFDTGLRDYFATDDLRYSNKAKEASILHNIDKNFPPSFISDGNLATFDKQAREFHNKLVSYNIESNLYLIETNNILQHGFELDVDNPYAKDVFEKQIEFMDKQIKKDLDKILSRSFYY